jgi:hypothetical protein
MELIGVAFVDEFAPGRTHFALLTHRPEWASVTFAPVAVERGVV